MTKLAMYKGKGLIGNAAIRMWTRSIYSHCELITSDGFAMSSSLMDGGVRTKAIDLTNGKWDVIELPWADADKVNLHFQMTVGDSYSWLDLIRAQIFNRPVDQKGASFCSEWCAAALGIPDPTSYSPATLLELCEFMNEFHA